jgi:hypothetical protein
MPLCKATTGARRGMRELRSAVYRQPPCGRPAEIRFLPTTAWNFTIGSSDFSGFTRTFTKDRAPSKDGTGTARYVWISATRHGRGTAWYVWISLHCHSISLSLLNEMSVVMHRAFCGILWWFGQSEIVVEVEWGTSVGRGSCKCRKLTKRCRSVEMYL